MTSDLSGRVSPTVTPHAVTLDRGCHACADVSSQVMARFSFLQHAPCPSRPPCRSVCTVAGLLAKLHHQPLRYSYIADTLQLNCIWEYSSHSVTLNSSHRVYSTAVSPSSRHQGYNKCMKWLVVPEERVGKLCPSRCNKSRIRLV